MRRTLTGRMVQDSSTESLLEHVERFVCGKIIPITLSGEKPPSTPELFDLTREAERIGLLPLGVEAGFGIWQDPREVESFQRSLAILTLISQGSAALALAWHNRSLGHNIALGLGNPPEPPCSVALDTHGGLARYSLARLLKGASLSEDDDAILRDYFASAERSANELYIAQIETAPIFLPVYENQKLEWQLFAWNTFETRPARVHGLDGLTHYTARIRKESLLKASALESGGVNFVDVLYLHIAGLLAIQTGVLQSAQRAAKRYALVREQGGRAIALYPAVQELLLTIDGAVNIARATLASLKAPDGLAELEDAIEKRSTLQGMLYTATTNAVQVLGGYGYMQDYLVERFVRDQNHLALLGGSATDSRLFLAELRGLNQRVEGVVR